MGTQAQPVYEFGVFRLKPGEHVLLRDGRPIPLAPKAFETLLALVRHSGHVVAKDELIRTVWPDTFVEENNLTQYISALRKALGESHDGDAYIETVPRLGYRFVTPVREVRAGDAPVLVARSTRAHIVIHEEEEQESVGSAAGQTRTEKLHDGGRGWRARAAAHRKWIAWSAALAVAGIVIAYFAFWRPGKSVNLASQPRTLAVLPFRNLQADAESDFLGVALADVASGQLSYTSQVVVHPSTSVHKYRGSDPNLERAPQEAQVQILLTGTYLKEGQGVRLSVELVAIPSHLTLWNGNFTAGMDGLITLQDLVAEQVGGALHLEVRRMAAERLKGAATRPNPAAYEYFLRGVDAWERHDLRAAIQWHEKAVNLDPDFAPALAHLAFNYISYCYRQSAYPNPAHVELGYIEKGLALYQKALEADAASPAILSLSGLYLVELGRLDEAVTLLRRALQLNPNYAEGHLWLSQAYRYGGMLQESRVEAELALRLDPSIREYSTVNTYLYLGEYEKFLQSMPRTQLGARIFFYRGLARYSQRDLPQAESEFRQAHELEPARPHAQFAQAFLHVLAGENEEGIRLLRRSERGYQADGEMLYKVAQAYAVLGDKPSALRLLRQSIAHNFYCYPYFARDPLLESLRAEPKYSALMELARQRHEAFRRKFF